MHGKLMSGATGLVSIAAGFGTEGPADLIWKKEQSLKAGTALGAPFSREDHTGTPLNRDSLSPVVHALLSEARHARSVATRDVTANCT